MVNFKKGKAYRKVKQYGKGAAILYRDVKYLKSVVNVESKVIDDTTSSTANTAGVITNISLIAEGSDYNERNGRRIKLQSLQIRGQLTQHASATNTSLRVIIFKTRNNQSAEPAVLDVLQFASENSMLNASDNQGSFTVVSDRTVHMSNVNSTNYGYNMYHKIQTHIDFSGSAATEASIGRGALYALLISNEASNTPTVNFHSRIRFVDN